jgi:hypothetical protein
MSVARPLVRCLVWLALAGGLAAFAGAANLTVNSTADDTTSGNGLVTLREAVAAANGDGATDLGDTGSGADTIVFDGALAGGTISLATANNSTFGPSSLTISSDVTIDGGGAPLLTIARSGAVARLRLFYVTSGGHLTLRKVTLGSGKAVGFDGGHSFRGGTGGGGGGLGGAVFNEGTLDVERSTFTGNQAVGGAGGPQTTTPDDFPRAGSGGGGTAGNGGAAAGDSVGAGGAGGGGAGGPGGDSTCAAGASGTFAGGGGGGGGIANEVGTLCVGGTGGFAGGGGGGGGRSTGFEFGAGGPGGFGGGHGGDGSGGGSIHEPGGGGGGGAGAGGAIFNHGGTVTVTNSTFSGNTAQGGAGGRNGVDDGKGGDPGQGFGGAIFNRNGSVTVLAATFTGNSANTGGGIYNLADGGTADATIDGSILANSSGGNDFESSGGGASAIGDDNLMESQSGFTGSIASTADPVLGGLAENGGPTRTHLQSETSPVLEASSLGSPSVDQRGETRPQGANRDIGAVELVYNHPPVAHCQDVTVPADGGCLGHASASDVDDGSSDPDGDPLTFELSPAGPYALGDTAVTLTVTDDGDLSDSCQATITVVDETPPAIVCPADRTLECPGNTTPAATGTPTATDNCTASPSIVFSDIVTPNCGGTKTIARTWTATDEASNDSSCGQTVKTIDTVPPVVIPGPNSQVCIWPANHKMVFINSVTASVQILDACDPHPVASAIQCRSSQCDDAPCVAHPGENGDGDTVGDCSYTAATDRLAMRSERAGTDPAGRTYSLDVSAVDGCGNVSAPLTTFTGFVPHNGPGQGCIKP